MSTGIIGGADGPTAIFVSSTLNPIWYVVGAVIVIAAVVGFIIWRKKRHTNPGIK